MKIVQVKNKSVLVELSYEEISSITKEEVYGFDSANRFCRDDCELSVGLWAKEFKKTTKRELDHLQNTIQALSNFLKNRLDVLDNAEKELKE